jgi:hypothetical protein
LLISDRFRFGALSYFWDEDAHITCAGLIYLASLPLEHLVIGCKHDKYMYSRSVEISNITDSIVALISQLPLKHLELYGCEDITDTGFAHISQLQLRYLVLHDFTITLPLLYRYFTVTLQLLYH